MNQLNIKIGAIIRDHRQIKHLTQLQLAKKLGYESPQFIYLFENGRSKCPIKVLGKCCKILDIDKDILKQMLTSAFIEQLNRDIGK